MRLLASVAESDAARVCVSTIYVEAMQVWYACPYCGVTLGGYVADPRSARDVSCEDCGGRFDIPARAALVIT